MTAPTFAEKVAEPRRCLHWNPYLRDGVWRCSFCDEPLARMLPAEEEREPEPDLAGWTESEKRFADGDR